jgi:hypothetical protein
MSDPVNHPDHYGGAENVYEAIRVIRAWNLGFSLGNAVKYICRAGKKDPKTHIQDLEKALWYLQEEITFWKSRTSPPTTGVDHSIFGVAHAPNQKAEQDFQPYSA